MFSSNSGVTVPGIYLVGAGHGLAWKPPTEEISLDFTQILRELDTEIARLQNVRAALSGASPSVASTPKRGRPKGSVNKASAPAAKKRTLSPEGRKAIADAMKRRWAERKKAKG